MAKNFIWGEGWVNYSFKVCLDYHLGYFNECKLRTMLISQGRSTKLAIMYSPRRIWHLAFLIISACAMFPESPLTLVAQLDTCAELIKVLRSGGAHLDFRTRDGLTALHKAVQTHNHVALTVSWCTFPPTRTIQRKTHPYTTHRKLLGVCAHMSVIFHVLSADIVGSGGVSRL